MDFKRYTINRRVINDLRERSIIGIAFYLVVLVVVLGNNDFYKRHTAFSINFSVFLTAICLFRLLHVAIVEKVEKISEKLSDNVFFGSVIISSTIWGIAYAVFLLQTGEHEPKLMMSICSVGLCAGGAIAFLPERRLSFAYIICMLLPAFASLRYKGVNPSASLLILFYAIYLMLIVFRGNREYWDALEDEYMLERKSDDLEKLSNTDALTDLYNRRYFNEMYEIEWERAVRNGYSLTVLICDIDHFKGINDIFGHLAGDEYLKKVADILKNVFKRKTDIVARYGGEEFIALLSGEVADHACHLAEQLRTEVKSARIIYNEDTIQATISIGIMNCVPAGVENRETVIATADQALYRAKKEGRDRFCDYSDIQN